MKIEARARLLAGQTPKDKKLVTDFTKDAKALDKSHKGLENADDEAISIVGEDVDSDVQHIVKKTKVLKDL